MTEHKNPILIDIPMPIETDRLLLRPPQPGDGQILLDAKSETFEQLQQWMPWAKEVGTIEDSEITCREAYAKFILREDFMLFAFDKKTGTFLGGTGLHRFDWNIRRFEIGYWIRASEQGKGYATEIANALTRYSFQQLNARAVTIGYADGNEASARVIQKLNFELEGRAKFETSLSNGDVVDSITYSRTNLEGLPDLQIKYEQ